MVLARDRGRLLRWADGSRGLAPSIRPQFCGCPTNRQGIAKSLVSSAIYGRPFSSLRVPTTAHDFAFAMVSTKKAKNISRRPTREINGS
jgi:hypothetical protein